MFFCHPSVSHIRQNGWVQFPQVFGVWNHPFQVANSITLPKTNKSPLKSYQDPKNNRIYIVSLCHHFSQPFAVKFRGFYNPNYPFIRPSRKGPITPFQPVGDHRADPNRHRSQESPPFSSSSCVEKMVVKAAEQVGSVLFRWRASCASQRILERYMSYAYNYLHSFTAVKKQVDVGEPSHLNIKFVLYH